MWGISIRKGIMMKIRNSSCVQLEREHEDAISIFEIEGAVDNAQHTAQ